MLKKHSLAVEVGAMMDKLPEYIHNKSGHDLWRLCGAKTVLNMIRMRDGAISGSSISSQISSAPVGKGGLTMPSDLIYREDAKDFVRHAYYKGLNPVEYLDLVPAADVRPVDEISDSVDEAIDYLNSVSNQIPYHVYSALFDLICGICHTCGADMRKVVEIEQIKEDAEWKTKNL